ncbi:MAG: UDP-4-amino-4,6-dideoxy-N-acetyl-beta-L-altrosamine N-acetyltransferase [Pseudomonadota bacterium]|nr:UDP-4-amino-4,6-dideoxy-N-acetyl-beta-L-altrosamine N-acetyltransferase [Pseudomonadota bacterium]
MLNRSDCRLRPMIEADADKVLSWRNQERIRTNMYTDHMITGDEHAIWVHRALADATARYLIFEWQGQPAGFVSITAIDPRQGRAVWAFYLGETTLPRGAGLAMEYLALEFAFEVLAIRKLMCEVFAFNAPVIKLHGRFGFQQEALYKAHARKNDDFVDVVGLALFCADWMENKAGLFKLGFTS